MLEMIHRVKKGVSVFRKGSGKSNLNVSGTFPQGGYDVKREREKWPCSYAFPQQFRLRKHTGFFTSRFRRRTDPEICCAYVFFFFFRNWINIFHFFDWNAALFETRFPNSKSSKLLPQIWHLVLPKSFCLLKFYKEKCPENSKEWLVTSINPISANDPWCQRFCSYCAWVPRFETAVTSFCASFELLSFPDHSLGFSGSCLIAW